MLWPIFESIPQENANLTYQFYQPIISGFFTVDCMPNNSEILLSLTNQNLFLSENVDNGIYTHFKELSFQLKFQILREDWKDDKTPGLPIGIKFQLNSLFISFYSSNTDLLNSWGKQLEKKINQRNFHQLFKAKKKIGKGAFAAVYLVQRLTDKKMFAVKAFSKEKQYSTEKGKESLQNQISIMRSINHPNIMKLESVFQTQNSVYVILQNMQGSQLNDYLKMNKKFNEIEICDIMRGILRGLSHLASKRIIHRDLKPDNIMFRNQNSLELVICDFGLSTYADLDSYLFVRCGTPGFVAPEIINIKDMSTKSEPISDVFSAGLIFHFLLFGSSIFSGKKYNEVLIQNRACLFDFTQEKYNTINNNALNLLLQMLETNPNQRITAEQALKHPALSNHMEIEGQIPIIQQIKPLEQIIINNTNNNTYLIEDQQKQKQTPSVFPKSKKAIKKKTSIFENKQNYKSKKQKKIIKKFA